MNRRERQVSSEKKKKNKKHLERIHDSLSFDHRSIDYSIELNTMIIGRKVETKARRNSEFARTSCSLFKEKEKKKRGKEEKKEIQERERERKKLDCKIYFLSREAMW